MDFDQLRQYYDETDTATDLAAAIAAMAGRWYKSSRSEDAHCVEVRQHGNHVQVRDSSDPGGPILQFPANEWRTFVRGVQLNSMDS